MVVLYFQNKGKVILALNTGERVASCIQIIGTFS